MPRTTACRGAGIPATGFHAASAWKQASGLSGTPSRSKIRISAPGAGAEPTGSPAATHTPSVSAGDPDPAARIASEQTLAAADLGVAADLSALHPGSLRRGVLP